MSNSDKRIKFLYKATGDKDLEERYVTTDKYEKMLKYESKRGWLPSIFMPKEAARIFLEVTDVRIERLQDIDDEGAKKEGSNVGVGVMEKMKESALGRFKKLWNSIIKKIDIHKYSWEANPWVWVIEFKRIEAAI